ncbi:MAG: 6-phosphogluconolactonase [Dissulfurispiraceae bacterium]|jgi:6-phosphogluconolactonase
MLSSQSPQVLVFGTSDQMAGHMVEKWTELSGHAIKSRGFFTAALSGGETPVPFYRRLAAEGAGIEWNKIHLFLADERLVPSDSPFSNYNLLSMTLLKNLPVPPRNIHAVNTDGPDSQSSAVKYEEEIKRFFMLRDGDLPEFDLILLGLGADGHTASLFPGDGALHDKRRLVRAVILDEKRHDRITLSLPVINNARMVVFLVSGKAKAEVLRDVVEKRGNRLPASLIKPGKGGLLFLADKEAAQYLSD